MSDAPAAAGRTNAGGKKRWLLPALYLAIVFIIISGLLAFVWIITMPERLDNQLTTIVAPAQLSPGSDASLRVVVQDLAAHAPVAGANVRISLQPPEGRRISLYRGKTDAAGTVPVSFLVPPDLLAPPGRPATLVVETTSPAGRDHVEQSVVIQRDYRLLLSTDKPLYQPGQTIHLRVLALSTADYRAAQGVPVNFLVEDAKGNKVFRKSVPTSDFGLAAADLTLSPVVNQGSYKISAAIGETSSEKTVEVRPYVLPKFAVHVSTDRSFYLPGQHVEGAIQADYFYGKPVGGGEVRIVGSTWEAGRNAVVDLRGQTDETGAFAFSFDLPAYFAGSGLESGQAQFALEVTVIDRAEHAEQTSQVLPIAAQPLVIEAIPESGVFKPEVENIVYVLTSYPDGRPASVHLEVTGSVQEPIRVESSKLGLAQFIYTPGTAAYNVLNVTATDAAGLTAQRRFTFGVDRSGGDSVLLRADRAAYLVGETIQLTVLTALDAGSVYLDVIRDGQTLSTRSQRVQNGRADFVIDVSQDMYGTIELHAYKVLSDGTIVRDTRLVVVDAPNGLNVEVRTDRESYRPGETANLTFRTGSQAALGLAIVDESVFALQEQDPGFAKLYFLLEQDLLQPRYQIKSFAPPSILSEPELRAAQDVAAKASWAGAAVSDLPTLNSRTLKQEAIEKAQQWGYKGLTTSSTVTLVTAPLAMLAAAIVERVRAHTTRRTGRHMTAGLAILILAACAMVGVSTIWTSDWYEWGPESPLLIFSALALVALVVYAWTRGAPAVRLVTLLTLVWGAASFLFSRASMEAGKYDPSPALVVSLLALLIPIAYIILGQAQEQYEGCLTDTLSMAFGIFLIAMLGISLLALLGPRVREIFGSVYNSLEGGGAYYSTPYHPRGPSGQSQPGEQPAQAQAAQDTQAAPRLRQYFPETLYWAPEVLTDESGYTSLQVPMADSITTWRLTAMASTQDGHLGFATRGIRVFQDFFVDIDLPVALTVDDEVHIPVGVFNYLAEPQQVRLVVEQEPWFELIGPGEQTITMAANDIGVVYFPIRVKDFGQQGFQVTAWGSQMSDAIRREVAVLPNGKEFRLSESDWLRESRAVSVTVPAGSVSGTAQVEVKIYPGVFSQVVEGLEKILQLPYG